MGIIKRFPIEDEFLKKLELMELYLESVNIVL